MNANKTAVITRRNILQWGLKSAGIYLSSAFISGCRNVSSNVTSADLEAKIPPFKLGNLPELNNNIVSPMQILRDFDRGTVTRENGRTVREFKVTAQSTIIKLNPAFGLFLPIKKNIPIVCTFKVLIP